MLAHASEVRAGWTLKRWGDLATLEYGKGLRGHEDSTGDFRVYGTNGPIGWTSSPLCPFPTVVVGRKGAYRGIHFSPAPCFVIDTAFYLNPTRAFDMRWAYYQLLTQDINGLDTGSAIPSTTRDAFYRLPVLEPPLDEQQQIASILGSLDDKIELNRQMCATLEGLARAIFRSWFVDFDPVRAKVAAIADGRDPEQAAMAAISGKSQSEFDALPAETLTSLRAIDALFPHEFEDSDLGSTPSGWTVERLDGWLDVLETGSRPKGGVGSITEGVPSVGAESVLGLGRFDFDKTKYVSADFAARMNRGKVADFDVLLYKDGGKPGVFKPRVTMFGLGFPFPEFVINEHVFRLRSVALGQSFLHFLVSDPRILSDLAERGGKAAIPGINQGDVKSQKFCVPPQELREEYASLVDPLIRRALTAAAESRKLASLRDALLPKLVSGELRLTEREEELTLDEKLLELAPWHDSVIGWLQDPGAVFREMFGDAATILRRDPATDLDFAESLVADLISEDYDGVYLNIDESERLEYIATDLAQFIGNWRTAVRKAGLLRLSEAGGA